MEEFLTSLHNLGNSTLFLLAVASTGVAAFLATVTYKRIHAMTGEDDRAYMDPLSWKLRLIWPLIRIVETFVCTLLPYDIIEHTEKRLTRTGVGYLLTAEQFIALRIILAVMFPVLAHVLMVMLAKYEPAMLIIAPLAGFFFPDVWLNDTRKKREAAVIRAMPVYLDFITMCVEAGLNLAGALAQALEKAPPGPLRNEFGIVLRDLRAGLPRSEALRRMADRLDIPEVNSFVSSVVQAEKMGASLARVMKVQANQRREERFQRAEKMAMEAPVKLVLPLVLFIFPVTFIVLGFPIAIKFMAMNLGG